MEPKECADGLNVQGKEKRGIKCGSQQLDRCSAMKGGWQGGGMGERGTRVQDALCVCVSLAN